MLTGRGGSYGFSPSVLLPQGPAAGPGRAGQGAAAEPEGTGPGGSHVGGGPSALLLGDGSSRGGLAPLLGVARRQEQGRAGAGVPLLAHEGEDPVGREGSAPAGTTPAPRGVQPLPSPLLGLRGDDGLGQEVPVELRLEEPRVGVLGEQRRQAPAQPCPALSCPALTHLLHQHVDVHLGIVHHVAVRHLDALQRPLHGLAVDVHPTCGSGGQELPGESQPVASAQPCGGM